MIKGVYSRAERKMTFPRIAVTDDERNNQLRSDERFREQYQHEHHHEHSILELLPIDMIKCFPIADALHLIDLGIVKR